MEHFHNGGYRHRDFEPGNMEDGSERTTMTIGTSFHMTSELCIEDSVLSPEVIDKYPDTHTKKVEHILKIDGRSPF
jgi:hypothetical protein